MTKEKARTLLIQIFNTYGKVITANYKDGVIQEAFEMAIDALRAEQTEPLDKDINVPSKEDCLTCRYNWDDWDSEHCDGCSKAHSNYEPFVMYYPQVDGITPCVIIERE